MMEQRTKTMMVGPWKRRVLHGARHRKFARRSFTNTQKHMSRAYRYRRMEHMSREIETETQTQTETEREGEREMDEQDEVARTMFAQTHQNVRHVRCSSWRRVREREVIGEPTCRLRRQSKERLAKRRGDPLNWIGSALSLGCLQKS